MKRTIAVACAAVLWIAGIGVAGATPATPATPLASSLPPPASCAGDPNQTYSHVSGNQLIDTAGNAMVPTGMTITGLAYGASWASLTSSDDDQITVAAQSWCVGYVRIQASPVLLFNQSPYDSSYLSAIEAQVDFARDLGLNVMLSVDMMHGPSSAENLAPTQLTVSFWDVIAGVYGGDPHVWFDLFNEPKLGNDSLGGFKLWRDGGPTKNYIGMQATVTAVRKVASNLLLVEGPNAGKSLGYLPQYPITGTNIAYAVHPYRQWNAATWDQNFGTIAAQVPVLADEWTQRSGPLNQCFPDSIHMVPAFIDYLAAHSIGLGGWELEEGSLVLDQNSYTPTVIDSRYACDAGAPPEGAGQLMRASFLSAAATRPA